MTLTVSFHDPICIRSSFDSKVGGLVILRHNEIRDYIGDIAAQPQVWNIKLGDSGLRFDLGVCDVGQP